MGAGGRVCQNSSDSLARERVGHYGTHMDTATALTAPQADALAILLKAKPAAWTRANGDTFTVSTGDALVRRGLATSRGFMRTSRGSDSAYRLTSRGYRVVRELRRCQKIAAEKEA